jgi:hypothetical protein
MPEQIRRIDYFYLTVPDTNAAGTRVLSSLEAAGVNLLGFSVFPHGAHHSQLDLIPEDSSEFRKAARTAGLKVSRKKSGFLIQGEERPGGMADAAKALANAHIDIISAQVFSAGYGRYGGMLWVGATDLRKAAKVLGAEAGRPSKPISEPARYPSPFDECYRLRDRSPSI